MFISFRKSVLFLSLSISGAALLAGCAGSFEPLNSPVDSRETPVGAIAGSVHGGQAPVTGAQIYLLAAATSGFGKASTSLITSGKTGVTCNTSGTLNGDCYVTTDAYGNFQLGGDYTCTAGTQVYMAAVGGNPGLSTTATAPVTTTATFRKNRNTITVASVTGISVGLTISGTSVGGTVTAVDGTTNTVTLSQNNTATVNGAGESVTFYSSTNTLTTATFSSGSNTITVASSAGVIFGSGIAGSGVGGTVTAVNGTTITLSQKTTSSGTNVPVTFASSGNNSAIIQMAALGQCPAAGNLAAQVPYLVINEVTTVAFAYSMSGFGTDAFHVSSDATGATALANALANANNIVNIQWGQAPAVANGNPNSVNPQAKLYTLADIAAQCVNTSAPNSSNCTSFFSLAQSAAGNTPTDESTALFNIAHNQAANATAIYNLMSTTPVFTPTLTSAPTDWTMPVIYSGLVSVPGTTNNQITSGPFNIAFDAKGNAWIGDRVKGVVEVGPQGAATTINKNFGMVKGVAVSPVDGNIWVADYGNNVVDVMNTAGTILTPLTQDMNGPIFTAFSGNTAGTSLAYEANETTTGVILFNSSTYAVVDFETGNFPDVKTPGWISVDNNGVVWLPSTSTNFVGRVVAAETGNSGKFTYSSSEVSGPLSSYSMSADSGGNLWFGSNTGNGDLEEIKSGTTTATDLGNGGGVNGAYKIAIDGNNTIWIANANANTVSAYNGGWLAANGFSTSAASGTGCVVTAPDPSGNLWTANADGSLTQLLGLATPTAAPLYGAVNTNASGAAGNIGTKP